MTSIAGIEYRERESWQEPVPAPTRVRVALAGCGAVGSALLREFSARRLALAERHGVEIVLTRVLVRDVTRRREATFDPALLTSDVDDFLAAEADVVIEAIGGLDPARRIAESALGRGLPLVTANKLLLASCGSELAALALENGTTLRYDAAVSGGVPILRVLDESLGTGGPARVRGILNGTANFVLTRLEDGVSFDAALDEARAAGFAEADASRDLDGRDAADKIALVARTVRSPARATRGNLAEVFTGWRAPLCASGPGAGGLPTATALLSDLVSTSATPRRRPGVPVATRDTRSFRWAIEIQGGPALLHRAVSNCPLVHTNDAACLSWTTIAAATASEMAELLSALTRTGASPIATRFDEACS